jgi:hypothetical protein
MLEGVDSQPGSARNNNYQVMAKSIFHIKNHRISLSDKPLHFCHRGPGYARF